MCKNKPDNKRKNNFQNSYLNGFNPTFKKKGNCFVCGKLDHLAPQCRRKARNENHPRVNIVQREDTIVAIVSQVNFMPSVS